jgi:hypothetical protein
VRQDQGTGVILELLYLPVLPLSFVDGAEGNKVTRRRTKRCKINLLRAEVFGSHAYTLSFVSFLIAHANETNIIDNKCVREYGAGWVGTAEGRSNTGGDASAGPGGGTGGGAPSF